MVGVRAVVDATARRGPEPVEPRHSSARESEGQGRVFLQPEQLHGLRARTSKEGIRKMTQIATVVGIDVSKTKLDWCIRGIAAATSENSPAGCAALAGELKRHGIARAVMEASGGYERTIAAALRKHGIAVVIVDPKRVRNFAKAAGRQAKNDAIDADTIAWLASGRPIARSLPCWWASGRAW
jgi:transposase